LNTFVVGGGFAGWVCCLIIFDRCLTVGVDTAFVDEICW